MDEHSNHHSEEVFDFSKGQMTQVKATHLKDTWVLLWECRAHIPGWHSSSSSSSSSVNLWCDFQHSLLSSLLRCRCSATDTYGFMYVHSFSLSFVLSTTTCLSAFVNSSYNFARLCTVSLRRNLTLKTLLRFLTWIPIGYIFETDLIPTLVQNVSSRQLSNHISTGCPPFVSSLAQFLPVAHFRNYTLQCLSEVGKFYPTAPWENVPHFDWLAY